MQAVMQATGAAPNTAAQCSCSVKKGKDVIETGFLSLFNSVSETEDATDGGHAEADIASLLLNMLMAPALQGHGPQQAPEAAGTAAEGISRQDAWANIEMVLGGLVPGQVLDALRAGDGAAILQELQGLIDAGLLSAGAETPADGVPAAPARAEAAAQGWTAIEAAFEQAGMDTADLEKLRAMLQPMESAEGMEPAAQGAGVRETGVKEVAAQSGGQQKPAAPTAVPETAAKQAPVPQTAEPKAASVPTENSGDDAAQAQTGREETTAPPKSAGTHPEESVQAGQPVLRAQDLSAAGQTQAINKTARTGTDIFSQLVDRAAAGLKDGTYLMDIRLKPEHLGMVTVRMALDADGLVVRIHALNNAVENTLSAQAATLEQALRDRGIDVVRVEVAQPNLQNGTERRDTSQDGRRQRHQNLFIRAEGDAAEAGQELFMALQPGLYGSSVEFQA